jgi:5-methylcytosine-specific restriction endonuclease McrA
MRGSTKKAVRKRAAGRSEYCLLHEDDSPLINHQIEHAIPRKHGGTEAMSNLALACIARNLYKGPNLSGIDPETGEITPLSHPRNRADTNRANDHRRTTAQ